MPPVHPQSPTATTSFGSGVASVVQRVVQRVDLELAAVARARVDLANAQRAAEDAANAVAYSWAYCQALEGISRTAVPERALWLRALALESERIASTYRTVCNITARIE